MNHYMVIAKQVPDVRQIIDNAFDPKKVTHVNSKLAYVINDLDTQATAFTMNIRYYISRG